MSCAEPMNIIVRPPRPGEMEAYYQLRWETLRKDRGLPPGSERDELDDTDEVRHLAVFVQIQRSSAGSEAAEGASKATSTHDVNAPTTVLKLVSVGRLELLRPLECRMAEHAPPGSVAATDYGDERVGRARLMGVEPEWRRMGVGRALAEAVIEAARHWDCDRVVADARAEAVYYYVACGFEVVSDEYYIKNIGPHRRVEKTI